MKRIGILLCCIVLCLLFPEKVHAEEIVSEKEPVDIIFVIDCSGSMKTNDVSRMGLSMVQAFVDTVQAEDIRIGYEGNSAGGGRRGSVPADESHVTLRFSGTAETAGIAACV